MEKLIENCEASYIRIHNSTYFDIASTHIQHVTTRYDYKLTARIAVLMRCVLSFIFGTHLVQTKLNKIIAVCNVGSGVNNVHSPTSHNSLPTT